MLARAPQPAIIQLMSDHGIKVEEFLVSEEIGVLGKTLKVQESACAPPPPPPAVTGSCCCSMQLSEYNSTSIICEKSTLTLPNIFKFLVGSSGRLL